MTKKIYISPVTEPAIGGSDLMQMPGLPPGGGTLSTSPGPGSAPERGALHGPNW